MENEIIFFSYSRSDASEFALKLAGDLRTEGVGIWIDQLDIQGGELWDVEIENALKASTCVLFIVSEKSVISNNVLDEVYYAIDEKKQVIPVLIHNCEVPYRLRRLQQINFINNYKTGFNQLLEAINVKNEEEKDFNKKDEVNIKPKKSSLLYKIAGGLIMLSLIVYGVVSLFNSSADKPVNDKSKNDISLKKDSSNASLKNTGTDAFEGDDSARVLMAKYYSDNNFFDKAKSLLNYFIKTDTCEMPDSECFYENGMRWYEIQSFYKAFGCFLYAAEKNNPKAMCMIGNMYYSGEWVKMNFNSAYQWYTSAEKYNNSVALLMLGTLWMEGKAVPKDEEQAKKYFNKVIANNDNANAVKISISKLKQLQ